MKIEWIEQDHVEPSGIAVCKTVALVGDPPETCRHPDMRIAHVRASTYTPRFLRLAEDTAFLRIDRWLRMRGIMLSVTGEDIGLLPGHGPMGVPL